MKLTSKEIIHLFARSLLLWFGLPFIAVGLYVVTASDWLGVHFYFTPLASVPGRVVGSQETNFAIDEERVYETFYRYQVQGQALVGSSFSTVAPMRPDTTAEVEYCLNRPSLSRLKNTNTGPFGFMGLIAGLVFICMGSTIVSKTLLAKWRILAILKDIAVTQAICQKLEAKAFRSDDTKDDYVAHYLYRANGHQYMHLSETIENNIVGKNELIAYQQNAPDNAVLVADLPPFLQAKISDICK
ncbi:MAG TPA: DUF3592 domain-containing protein [Hymenobacter sp.]|uniref:DUF3592 domain-containing protein n=1 Tax=Hymenobacter sp. TaxID=1898978 RepID=UPI002D80470C|nr:DUF3592 domain-containing protein [Hymenobacter sp.]HET9503669.1 DUF3592 domain-containing protein [Hymenobacter sp.]